MKHVTLLYAILLCLSATMVVAQDELSSENCLECHETLETPTSDIELEPLLAGSVHSDFECIDCHTTVLDLEHEEPPGPVDCGVCHDDIVDEYREHGRERFTGNGDLPSCVSCHGDHGIRSHTDELSPTHPRNLSATCASCHEDSNIRERHDILKDANIIKRYETSVHARAIADKGESAATCILCHSNAGSAHSIIYTLDPRSSLSHFNTPNTCGQCHDEIAHEFWRGIHGQLVARGATNSPVCTDCHGEHSIISPADPSSPVSRERLAEATCTPCHESARLNEKYGVSGSVVTRIDSYHGRKSAAGDVTVANCASCHQAHLILPHTDTLSSIHPANLQHTCGECHPEITPAVASIPIHATPAVGHSRIAAIVKDIYIALIILVVGGMLVHWAIDLRKHIKRTFAAPQVRRMTRHEVWQHAALTITFVTLVISGFALRHYESWSIFTWFHDVGMRGAVHRIAAVAFCATVIWHGTYLLTSRGRRFLRDMLPRAQDFKDLAQMLSYNFGRTASHPQYGRFSYVEKVEYWALVWGTIVMILTGLLLWFENDLVDWLSLEVFDVALVIHYYEAWLATLAILIWHFYATVFSPVVYPMNPAWLSGTMPAEAFRHEHGGVSETDDKGVDDDGSH